MNKRNQRKIKIGKVLNVSGLKSILVLVERLKRHKLYSKVKKLSKKYLVHDEKVEAKPGDKVLIMECRPISKRKTWRMFKVLKH
ncbi:30S ribosomal protein S17 [Candidatus Margulisiibacteriota bacterium]